MASTGRRTRRKTPAAVRRGATIVVAVLILVGLLATTLAGALTL